MDPAIVLLVVFMVYSVLLGVCLARMRAINREFDQMKTILYGYRHDAVRSGTGEGELNVTPELLDALRNAMGGANG